ncbi:hypothetical protein R3P38DRAFT_557517 [Favolaschia claudopus]|uniref:Uncharacterized protein n=1 Tax=Favolaschia claudopus TaxID=2862362 RepID=A0AAV9ZA90_9AGAR
MFRFGVLLSFTAVALALSSGDLRVSLKPVSSSVNSIDDIVLTAVVSNPTDQDIRVIAKNNVLDNSATSSFAVSKGEDGVLFTGVRTTLDLSADALYVTIPAGSSIAVNHTRLGPLFDFQTHGTGKFKFAPKTVFQTGYNADPLHVDTDAVEVSVTHDVAKRELIPLERRLSTPTCSEQGDVLRAFSLHKIPRSVITYANCCKSWECPGLQAWILKPEILILASTSIYAIH